MKSLILKNKDKWVFLNIFQIRVLKEILDVGINVLWFLYVFLNNDCFGIQNTNLIITIKELSYSHCLASTHHEDLLRRLRQAHQTYKDPRHMFPTMENVMRHNITGKDMSLKYRLCVI